MSRSFLTFVTALFLATLAIAQPVKVLFVGNSCTYEPGDTTGPALPENFKEIATALDKDVQVDYVVKGGQTLKRHFNEGEVSRKLSFTKYDYVIV